jgi:TRAP-type C4-dicarboxylate transport system permease small subunit
MAIVYASGIVFAVLAAFILALDLYRLLTGQLADEELVMVQESEEAVALQQILGTGNPPEIATSSAASHGSKA